VHGTEDQQPPPLPPSALDHGAANPGTVADTLNPYAAPAARTAGPLGAPVTLGGRGERLVAAFLDGLLYGVGFVPMLAVVIVYGEQQEPPPIFYVAALVGGVIWLVLFVYNLLLLQREGQTIAKRWMKLRIVRADGSRADLGRIFALRMLVPGLIGAVPCLGWLFVIADALTIFGEQQRCIHDIIADTIVVVA
jgi:uncharacterized RDD family membrane protein YckC